MESSEAASRRMNCIASHLGASSAKSCSSSLATMVCSSSSGIRKDGRLMYARQNSHVPAYLNEIKDCQGSNAGSVTQATGRKESRLMFARQGRHTQAYFMRERAETEVEKVDTSSQQLQYRLDDFDTFNKALSDLKHGMEKKQHTDEEPLFARPLVDDGNEGRTEELAFKELQTTHAKISELGWVPRMDISESKVAYVVTIELPGVNADGIRVEVNNDRLLVSGSRTMDFWKDNSMKIKEAFYHQRELSQGPFRAHWPIPKNSNIDLISADFIDGFLRIFVPKNA